MRILLTGANGFIGSGIAAALEGAGHTVVRAVRRPREQDLAAGVAVACDMARDVDAAVWRARLQGIEGVVNCAGILRERPGERFAQVHCEAPLALMRACADAGVRRVVQISALGAPEDAEFIASKHRFDAALAALPLDWTVLRPSVVYSPDGAYGGTSLLRAMAVLPAVIVLPGAGDQRLQPVALDDLARCVVACFADARAVGQIIEIGGPQALTMRDYLGAWRHWFGLPCARFLATPGWAVSLASAVGEWLGGGPLGRTMQRMLARGNVLQAGELQRMQTLLGVVPQPIDRALATRPCQAQDRLHARSYFLWPALLWLTAVVWLVSGVVGLRVPAEALHALFAPAGWSEGLGTQAVRAVSLLDLALGVAVLWPRTRRLALWAMLASVVGYTAVIGLVWPGVWLEPYGGLLKNLIVLPALGLLLAAQDRR